MLNTIPPAGHIRAQFAQQESKLAVKDFAGFATQHESITASTGGSNADMEGDSLPHWRTPEEIRQSRTYVPPAAVSVLPPPPPVRTLAEYEEIEGIIVEWIYGTQNLLLSQIVDAAQDEGMVWILVRPSSSDSTNIKSYLTSRSIPLTNIEFLTVNTNSIWSRDYGPWMVYDTVTDSMGILDFRYNRPRPLDDNVPVFLSQQWNLPLYQTLTPPDSLAHTGGNFMVDGFGTGFSSKLIWNENPNRTHAEIDSILSKYAGISRFVTMDTLLYDVIHHIDMHMKLLDEETLLIGQYPAGASDYARIESTVDYLRTLNDCYGRPYRIIRIPMPPDNQGRYPPQSNYFTYTNSVFINKTILVPIYNLAQDQQALQIYRDALPGYRVLGFDCNSIIPQLGAIHCITKEIGLREPVVIGHARWWEATDTLQSYHITTTVTARSGVDSAFVYWRTDSLAPFTRISMSGSTDAFTADIPQQPPGTHVAYYIEAVTGSDRRVTKPIVGAAGPYEFDVVSTSPTTVSTSTRPQEFRLDQNYPNPFNPTTRISFEIGGSGFVSLKVYNLLGQEIATLVNGNLEPGEHATTFDGTSFTSGVYYYRLQSEGNSQTKKMLLLR